MSIFEHEGQKYVRIGDKAIPFDSVDADGKPIIIPIIENIVHTNGRKDVIVRVPCLTIQQTQT